MDIINVLTQEHQRVMALFERGEQLQAPASTDELFVTLVQELSLHEKAEQAAVWNRLREQTVADLDLEELVDQEGKLEALLEELVVSLGSEDLKAWLGRVRELVVQHVRTEETRAFPLIEQLVDAQLREQLGTDYMAAKNAETAQMAKLNVIMAPELQNEPLRLE